MGHSLNIDAIGWWVRVSGAGVSHGYSLLFLAHDFDADGPKVIEFNSRFGDPETQIILPRLTSDFAQNITDILDGKEPNITWTDKGVTLGVVVASNGYPLDYEKGVKLPAKRRTRVPSWCAAFWLTNR